MESVTNSWSNFVLLHAPRHAGARERVLQFNGTTDGDGRLRHEAVFPGDYTLSLSLAFFEGEEQQVDTYQSSLVVLEPAANDPVVRMIGAVPRVVMVRMRGMLFFAI